MNDQSTDIVPVEDGSWQAKTLLIGGLAGAVLGLMTAFLYMRAAEEEHGGGVPPEAPSAGDAVKVGMSLLTLVRTISEWGRRS